MSLQYKWQFEPTNGDPYATRIYPTNKSRRNEYMRSMKDKPVYIAKPLKYAFRFIYLVFATAAIILIFLTDTLGNWLRKLAYD